jgi:hypothetical protein
VFCISGREMFSRPSPSVQLAALVAFLCGIGAAAAEGSTITVDSNLANGTYLTGGTSGQFDVSSMLAGNTIVSGVLSFGISDDSEGYSYAGQSGSTYFYNNPYEAVTLTTGAQSTSGATSYSESTTSSSYIAYWVTYSYSCGWFDTCYGSYPVYAYNYYRYSGYTGSFPLSIVLDSSGLAALATTGVLPFTLSTVGDAALMSARLTLDLQPTPLASVPDSGSTLVLLATAIAAITAIKSQKGRRAGQPNTHA